MKQWLLCAMAAALVVWLRSAPTRADESSSARAAEYFERGAAHVQAGDVAAAAREFETAYRLHPHYSVLYNLGQAYVLMGRPVEAIQALTRYLEAGGTAIHPQRRAEVLSVIALNRKRVGELRLRVEPKSAAVEIDGHSLGTEWQKGPIPVASGRHAIVITAPGYATRAESVLIETHKTASLEVQLTELPEPKTATASLTVVCDLADVRVFVDNTERAKTPVRQPLNVSPGAHRIRFSRTGYADDEQAIIVDHKPARVVCALKPDKRLNTAPDLEARPEYVRDYRERVGTQRTWAYVMGGSGIVFGAAAVTFAVLGSSKHEDYERERAELRNQPPGEPYRRQAGIAQNEALAVQRLDDLTIGSAVIGTALLAAGVGLFATAGNPDKYRSWTASLSVSGTGFAWGRRW